MKRKLDSLDVQLLGCLQRNNIQTAEALAEQVGRSPSAVARRVRRLRANGSIMAEASVIAEEAAGNPLFAIVQIQLERHSQHVADGFRRDLAEDDRVQFYLEVSGAVDVVLMVAVGDMEAFNEFAERMLSGHPSVSRFETMFVKRRVKASLAVPLKSRTT